MGRVWTETTKAELIGITRGGDRTNGTGENTDNTQGADHRNSIDEIIDITSALRVATVRCCIFLVCLLNFDTCIDQLTSVGVW